MLLMNDADYGNSAAHSIYIVDSSGGNDAYTAVWLLLEYNKSILILLHRFVINISLFIYFFLKKNVMIQLAHIETAMTCSILYGHMFYYDML